MLNLHQLTNYKAQLNKINVNNWKFDNLAGSYQRGIGVTERLWQTGFCKQVSFELLPEGGNRCGTTYIRKDIPNPGSIKSKTKAKVFGSLVE